MNSIAEDLNYAYRSKTTRLDLILFLHKLEVINYFDPIFPNLGDVLA